MEYKSAGISTADKYISIEKQVFNSANLVTDVDGKIRVMAGQAPWDTAENCDKLVRRLTKKHGEPNFSIKKFTHEYALYTWTLTDRIIKLAMVETNESNVMKLEIERDATGQLTDIREGQRRQQIKSYIFVLDSEWADTFITTGQGSGDFVYCQ